MPVISTYSSSGSSYISSSTSRYPKSSYSDRKYYPSLSSGINTSSTSSGLYRKGSYRYDLPLTSSSSSSVYRREDRESNSAHRTLSGTADIASSGSSKTSTSTSGRYSSVYGGYSSLGSSSLSRDFSHNRSSLKASNNNSYVSNLRHTALCGAELYERYSLSTFKPGPSFVDRAAQAAAAATNNTSSSGIAALKGSSPIVSSLEPSGNNNSSTSGKSSGNKLQSGVGSKELSSSSGSYRASKDYDLSYRLSSPSTGASSLPKSSYNSSYDVTDSVRGRKEGLCGLWNIGNTCFMNSIIQCLSHTRELTAFLRQQPSTERGTSKDQRILVEYTKLIKDMWSGTQRSVNPSELKYAFSSKHRMYSGSAQQDAQEFLRFFLDSLHGALNVAVKRDPLGELDDDMNNRVKADMLWDWYSKAENSMIKDLFVGQLRSTLKCTYCSTESTMFDPFWDLSLPLPSSNSRCKLENCLEMFIKEEILDGIDQPTCSKCNSRRKCTKSLTIERFPKYLVIHLKRFSETRWSKLTNVIEFPCGERGLNLQPYASEDNVGPAYYSLYGISNHMGSTAGGHYVAVCKHPKTKEWNEFNDNFVSETSERSLVTSSAYVLFYERA